MGVLSRSLRQPKLTYGVSTGIFLMACTILCDVTPCRVVEVTDVSGEHATSMFCVSKFSTQTWFLTSEDGHRGEPPTSHPQSLKKNDLWGAVENYVQKVERHELLYLLLSKLCPDFKMAPASHDPLSFLSFAQYIT
jgi:hypothetical protein